MAKTLRVTFGGLCALVRSKKGDVVYLLMPNQPGHSYSVLFNGQKVASAGTDLKLSQIAKPESMQKNIELLPLRLLTDQRIPNQLMTGAFDKTKLAARVVLPSPKKVAVIGPKIAIWWEDAKKTMREQNAGGYAQMEYVPTGTGVRLTAGQGDKEMPYLDGCNSLVFLNEPAYGSMPPRKHPDREELGHYKGYGKLFASEPTWRPPLLHGDFNSTARDIPPEAFCPGPKRLGLPFSIDPVMCTVGEGCPEDADPDCGSRP